MTVKEKIRAEIERVHANTRYVKAAPLIRKTLRSILHFIDSLPEEPVSKDLEEASIKDFKNSKEDLLSFTFGDYHTGYVDGAKWQKSNLWHDAQGDDLPEIDREVVAFQTIKHDKLKEIEWILRVVIAHRPNPKGWDGRSFSTGKVEHYTPKTYDKGGWNMPDVKYWLDAPLPKGIEL